MKNFTNSVILRSETTWRSKLYKAITRLFTVVGLLMFFSSSSMANKNVSYDGNGETNGTAPTTKSVSNTATITIEPNSGNLLKTGYIFSGWNTNASGTGTTYQPGNSFTLVNVSVTFYAKWVLAQTPPTSDAGADQTVIEGSTITLDGSGSSDSDGTVTNYSWLVDGTTYTGVKPSVTGLTEGTYTVVLTVTDNGGATDTDEMQITVTSSAPPENFTCANPRTFSQVYYANLPGQIDIIGNSVLCQNTNGQCGDPGNNRNNNINMMYINADGDATTFNHSSAELNIPANSEIKWAGLYWQGIFAGPTSTQQNNSKTIKLKIPGGSYVDVTADSNKFNWVYLDEAQDRWMYQGVADITSIIDVNNPNGYYEIANLHTSTGTPAGGSFGAWSIVIAYYNKDMPIRNLSVYDGYQGIMPGGNGSACNERTGDPKSACLYAQNHGCPIDLASTGVANPISVPISGFLTPKGGAVESAFALFSGEGDRGVAGDKLSITNKSGNASDVFNAQNPVADVQNATISKKGVQVTTLEPQATLAGGTPWINTLGADIDLFDISDKLDNDQSATVINMNTSGDGYFPGVFAFSTELYQPSLCYDYAYKQNERYFTEDNNGSYSPKIIGTGLYTSDPITVELYIQNTEVSDITLSNVSVDVFDINTTQAIYSPNTTFVINPGKVFPNQYNTLTGIPIANIDSQDRFYLDYDLDIFTSNINMPLNVRLRYTATLPVSVGTPIDIEYETYLNTDIPLCSALNFTYQPSYGNFNVENSILAQNQKYNLPTQTVGRAGDFTVTSYDPLNVNTRKGISTAVAVDLIDAGKYHGIDASCSEPDSALTPRIWLIFDNNQTSIPFDANTIATAIANGTISDQISGSGTPITSAAEFYGNARENTAFRVSFNQAGDEGNVIQLKPSTCNGQQIAPCVEVLNFPDLSKVDLGNGEGRCVQDIDGNPNSTDTIPQNCGNAGAAGMDSVQLAVCMECLYGYNIDYYCSRDNFATRPESFRMRLNDQNQTDTAQKSFIATNDNISSTHTNNSAINVVAGYTYGLDINATNYQNEDSSPGYFASFLADGEGGDRSIRFDWFASANDAACNDTSDQNQTTDFFNGAANVQLISQQIGKYNLTLLDRKWTKVDWDTNSMAHHFNGPYAAYFVQDPDCRQNSSIVPIEDSTTASYLDDTSGCDITTNDESLTPSYHTNIQNTTYFTDLALFVYPYTFNHASLLPTVGPNTRTNGQNFVYMDTPPLIDTDNKNMSYNMNGTFYASGYNGVQLSNFVTGCYAEDINMSLNYIYNTPNQNEAPYLWYSLKDHNTTDTSVIYNTLEISTGHDFARPVEPSDGISPLNIIQDDTYFAKEMSGAITMDLGYNFKREMNKPINPREITFNDFTLSYQTIPNDVYADMTNNYQIKEVKTLGTNVNFVYGRAKPSQNLYDDILANQVSTPISTVIYCEHGSVDCSAVYGLTTLNALTDQYDWYLSLGHIMTPDGDGNITLAATNGGTVTSPVSIDGSNGLDPNVIVTDGGQAHPLDVDINLDAGTDRWLIYNPDKNDSNPNPFYRVRFIGQSGWAGHGDTGHVVDSNVSTKKNRRLGW